MTAIVAAVLALAGAALTAAVTWAVESQPSSTTELLPWVSVVTPMGVLMALFRGWLVVGRTHDACVAENVQLKADLKVVHAGLVTDIVPAMTRQTDLMIRMAEREQIRQVKNGA